MSHFSEKQKTLRHFEVAPRDCYATSQISLDGLPKGQSPNFRLAWSKPIHGHYDPNDLAQVIRDPLNCDIQYFPDANFAIVETNSPVWDALRQAANRTVLAAPVYHELKEWLAAPRRNHALHSHITSALQSVDPQWLTTFGIGNREPVLKAALDHYVSLLLSRRMASKLAEIQLRTSGAGEPTRNDVMNFCKDQFGLRTQLLAKKGRDDSEEKGHVNVNDEVLVVMAILRAIASGRQTMILTHDRDVLELFYKAIWFFDTHYKAMHFARCYSTDPFLFGAGRIDDSMQKAFEGEVILLKKPSCVCSEVLPLSCTVVPIHCVYIGSELLQLTFCLETEMSDLINVKSRTNGLCTDLFEGRNIHIDLGPVIQHFGDFAAIGKDLAWPGKFGNTTTSYLDLMHSVHSNETFFETAHVPSELLIVPPFKNCRSPKS